MIYEIRGVEFMLSMVWVIYRKYDRYKECIEMRKKFWNYWYYNCFFWEGFLCFIKIYVGNMILDLFMFKFIYVWYVWFGKKKIEI